MGKRTAAAQGAIAFLPIAFCCVLMLAPGLAYSQNPGVGVIVADSAAVPKAEPLPKGSVTGHVICEDTHGPARGARVMLFRVDPNSSSPLEGAQPLFAATRLDGSFFLPHVAPGEYLAVAFAAGYLSAVDGIIFDQGSGADSESQKEQGAKMLKQLRAAAPSVTVASEGAARVDIELRRGAVLAGRVLYSDGSPASQIDVQIENVNDPKRASKGGEAIDAGALLRMFTIPRNPTTDDLGGFRLSGIAPGTYRLAVVQSFGSSSLQDGIIAAFSGARTQPGKLTIYSGNTLHKKEAKTYDLRAGDTVSGIEITLPLNGLHTVQGTASGKGGVPLNSGSVDLTDTVDDSISFHAAINQDSEFAFIGVPEGSYTLKLTGGYAFDNPPPENFPVEAVPGNLQQFKPTHAFADLTQTIMVGSDDIDNLALTPDETKLPDMPAQAPDPGDPDQPSVPPAL